MPEDVKNEPETLKGSVEGIIYSNEETGYTILDFGTDKNELVTVVGTLPYVAEGDELIITGRWVHNPKYGRQFKAEQFEKKLPSDASAILRYLSSGAIKGLGPKKAARIVEQFGEQTFEVMENHPEWLTDIPGISRKMAFGFAEEFAKQAGVRSAMLFFRTWFGSALTVRIYKEWGTRAVDIAQRNPYALCEIDGIGFEKADSVAADIGFDRNSAERVKSGVLYLLRYNASVNGHTCLPENLLIPAAVKLLDTTEQAALSAVAALLQEDKLRQMRVRTEKGETLYYFDRSYYEAEKSIASRLVAIDRAAVSMGLDDINAFIAKEERGGRIAYAQLQKTAIAGALESGVMILTGGPGTGKTTVVRALLHIFSSMGLRTALAAPTGRASKRLSEATSHEAKTVHRLLEMSYSDGGHAKFARDEENRLNEDVIIVDETSMLDVPLTAALVKAVKPGAKLIFIGDADQLPSVGPGNVLHDLIRSGRFTTVELTEIFRQARDSLIVTNAHAINHGKMPELYVKNNDFFYLKRDNDREIALTIADLCRNRLPKTYGAEIVGDIQVITPSRKGEAGTENLNCLLQATLNPPAPGKREHKVRDTVFREGDRVMQIHNNYDLEWERYGERGFGIFNGDIGVISEVKPNAGQMVILSDERRVVYDFKGLDELELAYAVTVHKSQGSEYPVVILPLYDAPPMLLARNLLYTAVTRAQRMVILVGKESALKKMVENNREARRFTGLCAWLYRGKNGK